MKLLEIEKRNVEKSKKNFKEIILNEAKPENKGSFGGNIKKSPRANKSEDAFNSNSPYNSPKNSRNLNINAKSTITNGEKGKFVKNNLSKNQPTQKNKITQPTDMNIPKKESAEKREKDKHNSENLSEENENESITSPFMQLIDDFKRLLLTGIKSPKTFLNSNIMSCEEDSKVKLDKILKVNSFCEEIELLEIDVQNIKKQMKYDKSEEEKQIEENIIILQNESTIPEQKDISPDQELISNILQISSERRISVYNDLFKNLNSAFEDIIKISGLKIDNGKTSERVSVVSKEDDMFFNIKKLDKSKFHIDNLKPLDYNNEFISGSMSESVSLRGSYISNANSNHINNSKSNSGSLSQYSIDEEFGQINIPDSKIKSVSIGESNNLLEILKVQKKILYDSGSLDENKLKFYSNKTPCIDSIKDFDNASTNNFKLQQRPTLTESTGLNPDVSVFMKARKELGSRSTSQLY